MTRPFCLGLTGSIGMGKSTTAALFADAGIPVWDADATVHRLYESGGAAVERIRELVPEAIVAESVDRRILSTWLSGESGRLQTLEALVHPLVRADREAFIGNSKAEIVLLDIPLLFETGSEAACDAVAVVSADPAEQRRRVLERPGMSEARLETILARQMPDSEKRARADFIIPTDSIEGARRAVLDILDTIRSRRDA